MKCPSCGQENKENSKLCKKCGADFSPPLFWKPDWRWHAKVLIAIYVILVIVYFSVSAILSRVALPYRMRDIPEGMAPWLKE